MRIPLLCMLLVVEVLSGADDWAEDNPRFFFNHVTAESKTGWCEFEEKLELLPPSLRVYYNSDAQLIDAYLTGDDVPLSHAVCEEWLKHFKDDPSASGSYRFADLWHKIFGHTLSQE